MRTNAQIAAQVAVESVIDNREAYSEDTVAAVIANGVEENVAQFYMDMIR